MQQVEAGAQTVAVVGTGAMGKGIAQIAVQSGSRVFLFDADPGAAERARSSILETLGKLAEKGKVDRESVASAASRLAVADGLGALAPCGLVIEAIVEDLQAKRMLFAALEDIVSDECILATNTSSLSVTAIAAGCRHPRRVAGFHFFNPVPLMRIVEVIAGLLTDPQVCDALASLAVRMGHTPVRAKDTPGFIVNHAGRGYVTEALRCAAEGVADFEDIDRILRDAAGFRMGPFELLDLTGLDVSHPVMESIYRQFYDEPRFRPSTITAQRLAGGVLGRKTGRGFYDYSQGKPSASPEPEPSPARPQSVWVGCRETDLARAAAERARALGARVEEGERPSAQALCVLAPLGGDATDACAEFATDPARSIAIDLLFPQAKRTTLMATPLTTDRAKAEARGLFGSDGRPVTLIRDSAGFVAQRVVAHIVNIACDIAQQRVATPADIDRAVILGLGYPAGPLALGDAIGGARVLRILEKLHALSGDPRYRPSPWLRRRAALGVSLATPED